MLRFALAAHRNGVAILFNTGRWKGRDQLVQQLRAVGYPVDRICLRTSSREPLDACKQATVPNQVQARRLPTGGERRNRATDFTGGGYDRGFKLPDYSGRLP